MIFSICRFFSCVGRIETEVSAINIVWCFNRNIYNTIDTYMITERPYNIEPVLHFYCSPKIKTNQTNKLIPTKLYGFVVLKPADEIFLQNFRITLVNLFYFFCSFSDQNKNVKIVCTHILGHSIET